jgi:hypothetical protein
LYYIGTVILNMDERSFWRCTPRKLIALWDMHKLVNGLETEEEKQQKVVPIDQVGFL